jgi:aspartate/methionine/tyrosine aminotransferase
MATPINPNIARTYSPPVMEARRWLDGSSFPPERPLINVSQAAPTAPPPVAMRQAIADMVLNDPAAHLYGPVLGLPELRDQVAQQWSSAYGGQIDAGQVAITSGCNQAFVAAITSLASAGDEVLIPTPWYFNHKMHLTMAGIQATPLPTDAGMQPDPAQAAALITARTRAILLVSPNNPSGAQYPAALVRDFHDLARAHGIALIVDETYRDFDSRTGAPHDLFADPDWDQTLIHLYSFSKAFRLTGHRVGAMIAAPSRLHEVEKYLDTVTICPNQIGQRAALWGLRNLSQWLAGQRAEILDRRAALEQGFHRLAGWRLMGLGAYFAYVAHPFDAASDVLAPEILARAGVLMLPGTMFRPPEQTAGSREFRIAFANIDRAGINTLFTRLENLPADLAPPR